MENESHEKQHQATGKRLSDLRRKGTVMRSRDLTGGLLFIITVMMLTHFAVYFKERILNNFTTAFDGIKYVLISQESIPIILKKIIVGNLILILPIFGVMFVIVMLSPFLFGGWNFTLEAIQFNLGKLNPITNIKNNFSPKRIFSEMIKSMIKATLLITVLIYFVMSRKEDMMTLLNYPTATALEAGYSIVMEFVILLCCSLIFLVLFDVIFNFFQFQKQIKMTTQELKDEYKDTEGSVEVKRKIRSKQMAVLMQRLTQTVPRANVIVTNPTHYSVALRYVEGKDHAPKVVAKGTGAMAQKIRHLAIANAIPIYEAPVLARAIYHTTKIGAEIHPGLYMAVAIVLTYVQQLKNYQLGVGQLPKIVQEFQIPKEFVYDE